MIFQPKVGRRLRRADKKDIHYLRGYTGEGGGEGEG